MGRKHCFIKGCSSDSLHDNGISFFLLSARDPINFAHWIRAVRMLNNQDISNHPKYAYICSKHFTDDCFDTNGIIKRLLKNAAPSIFEGIEEIEYIADEVLDPGTNTTIEINDSHDDHNQRQILFSIDMNLPEPTETASTSQHVVNFSTPRRKPRVCYPGDITDDYENASPRTLIKYVRVLKKNLLNKKKQIKRLNKTNSRQKLRLKKMKDLFSTLQKKNYITRGAEEVLQTVCQDEPSFLHAIKGGKVRGQYPPELRTFALTLHFYSPRAYQYVRSLYKTNLPAPSTIRGWYSHTDGSPGFTKEALEVLKKLSPLKGLFSVNYYGHQFQMLDMICETRSIMKLLSIKLLLSDKHDLFSISFFLTLNTLLNTHSSYHHSNDSV